MNRRNFIKIVTGFVGGVYAAFLPKAKGLAVADVVKAKEICESDKALLRHIEKAVNPPIMTATKCREGWHRKQKYPLGTRRGGKIYVKAAEDIHIHDAVNADMIFLDEFDK